MFLKLKRGVVLNKIFWILANIAAVMFAVGMVLPYVFAFLLNGYNWSPVIWDVLQLGGLGGVLVFGLMYRMTKPKQKIKDEND